MIIPIMHCFDHNYVIPGAVAFYSLLKNSDPNHTYEIWVLHNGISSEDQIKLKETISPFRNASINFLDMHNRFEDLFSQAVHTGHYSKESLYKFIAPSIFTQYEKIMIADVDVVYLNDISTNFIEFNIESSDYLAGCKGLSLKGSFLEGIYSKYSPDFSSEEISKLQTGGGYYIFNLKKMREDNIENRLIKYAFENTKKIRQLEQDVVNLICYPYIKILPANSMVCTYHYDMYKSSSDLKNDIHFSESEVKNALASPIQLHYATATKPWSHPECTKSIIWFSYLFQTPFSIDYLSIMENKYKLFRGKTILDIKVPFSKRNRIVIKKTR